MATVNNKPLIDKCIISFSHDLHASRLQADKKALEKAQNEIASGKKGISHLILRAADDKIDRLKFLFLIHGIPLMCYSLANLLQSSLKEIAVVGSLEVKQVLDKFLETANLRGKSIRFISEDPDNPSLMNTLALGKSLLTLEENELVLFQPGDLPFMYDIEKVLQDGDIQNHNVILWLNSRQKMFPRYQENPDSEFVQRNYHYRAIYSDVNEVHDIKEPNVYPINLAVLEQDIMDKLHSQRKDGQILIAGLKKALSDPLRFLRLIPMIFYHWRNFKPDLKKFRSNDHYKFGAHEDNFNRGTSILLNTACATKIHDDPAFVSDVDALEDWEDFEALIEYSSKKYGAYGLVEIHPMGKDLLKFKEQAMSDLKNKVPMYKNFPAYINDLYRSLEMGYLPFGGEGDFASETLHSPRTEAACHWYKEKCETIKTQTR